MRACSGNPNMLDSKNINFEKVKLVGDVLMQVQTFQAPYHVRQHNTVYLARLSPDLLFFCLSSLMLCSWFDWSLSFLDIPPSYVLRTCPISFYGVDQTRSYYCAVHSAQYHEDLFTGG